jgi:hypothetical protein
MIYTGPELGGREIEVSPVGTTRPARTHAMVRERRIRPTTVYSVLIQGLRAGQYVIWRDAEIPLAVVAVGGGSVTEFWWPSAEG